LIEIAIDIAIAWDGFVDFRPIQNRLNNPQAKKFGVF